MRTILSIIGMVGGVWFAAASLSHGELMLGYIGLLVVCASAYIFVGTNLGKHFFEDDDND